jgi:hypothetical protein
MMNGVVYAVFGSHCDHRPYEGWIAGVSTSGKLTTLWATSPRGGSIWQSGGGLVSDGPGRIFFSTGNDNAEPGVWDPPVGPGEPAPEGRLGESVVRVEVQPKGELDELAAKNFFSPFNSRKLDAGDLDLGSSAPVALPSEYFGTPSVPHLLIQEGKDGHVYLLNRDSLGGRGEKANSVVQELGSYGGVWGAAAVWPGNGGYLAIPSVSTGGSSSGSSNHLRFFKYETSGGNPRLSLAATTPDEMSFGSGSPIVTSDGTADGSALTWITWCPGSCRKAELRAYTSAPSGEPKPLWSAPIGFASEFSRPYAAEVHIYVGNRTGHIIGFSVPPPTVTKVSPAKGPVAGGTSVTITGTNFTGAAAVQFGSTAATSFTVKSATSITAISPAETAGRVDVRVTAPGGTSAISSADHFKFVPTVTGLSPNTGSKAGSTSVTVSGTGFALGKTATVLKFGTTKAASVNCTASTTCIVVSPAHEIGNVDVKATVNKVSSANNAPADQFTYN